MCGKPRRRNQVACRGCWKRLPKHLQEDVWAWYREDPGSEPHLNAIVACLSWSVTPTRRS